MTDHVAGDLEHLAAPGTFASRVLAQGPNWIVEICCGSSPHLGLRLLTLGYRQPVTFIDWSPAVAVRHCPGGMRRLTRTVSDPT